MKHSRIFKHVFVYCMGAVLFHSASWAGDKFPHPDTYLPASYAEIAEHKAFYDDPRPILETFGPKQVLPPELYEYLTYDIEKMKSLWAELVGFRAPDVVGKIAPEIKPGKYTYKDLEKYPGFKELMYPELYKRIKPGGPPHAGNIPEFEIIPTRQYYFALPIAQATQRNMGKTQLDEQGYIKTETWLGGYPFPRPSGKFKAQQIMFNVERNYLRWGNNRLIMVIIRGYDRNLKEDMMGKGFQRALALAGRVLMEPYGWYDETAKQNGAYATDLIYFLAPRDLAGMVRIGSYYLDPQKFHEILAYVPFIRRIRKVTATDTQDPVGGQDIIDDDTGGFAQKLTPERYPYKYELIEEREYLVVAPSLDGSEYVSSEGLEWRNIKMERRPMYVVKLTQLDPNYVYSKRILYIDKEMLTFGHIENYDQKGRLYRTFDNPHSFFPEMGMLSDGGALDLKADHLDLHSGVTMLWECPAFYTREDVGQHAMMKYAK